MVLGYDTRRFLRIFEKNYKEEYDDLYLICLNMHKAEQKNNISGFFLENVYVMMHEVLKNGENEDKYKNLKEIEKYKDIYKSLKKEYENGKV